MAGYVALLLTPDKVRGIRIYGRLNSLLLASVKVRGFRIYATLFYYGGHIENIHGHQIGKKYPIVLDKYPMIRFVFEQ